MYIDTPAYNSVTWLYILLPLLLGVKPDVMLYNALLSVYIQNNHNFNPLEVLEKMEKNTIEPNRVWQE